MSMNAPISEENGGTTCVSPERLNDELLVAAAQSGDRGAFVELCERHSRKVLPAIYRITGIGRTRKMCCKTPS